MFNNGAREASLLDTNRRQFLRGDLHGERVEILPPWAAGPEKYYELCSRCGDCISDCPQSILQPDRQRFPRVNFTQGECTFCGACADRCTTGALNSKNSTPWHYHASIEDSCLARSGVICSCCAEQCESQAVQMQRVAGGAAYPVIQTSQCSGCGACVSVCPTQAVVIKTRGQ